MTEEQIKTFVGFAIVYGVLMGGFFGMMFTIDTNGWKKVLILISTMVVTGCVVSGLFCIERYGDEIAWNNGSCPTCNIEWVFSNADHIRNGGTHYYYYCKECGKIIEIHSQFSK